MNTIKRIRNQLGLTQAVFGAGIGCTQGNVWHYETGHQSVPPIMAAKIISFAASHGVTLSYDDIYADVSTHQQPSQAIAA